LNETNETGRNAARWALLFTSGGPVEKRVFMFNNDLSTLTR